MQQVIQPNPTKIATKWALISVVTSIVITYAFEFLNVDANSGFKYIGYIPFIAFLFLAQYEFKQQLGGYLTFSQGFSTGFRYAIFSGLLLAIFIYLYLGVLSPDVFEKSLAASETQMLDKGMSSDQVDKGMAIARKYGPLFGAFGAAIMYALMGIVLSLIGAAIFKKERSPFDVAEDTTADPAV